MDKLTKPKVAAKKRAAAPRMELYFVCFLPLTSVQSPSGCGNWLKLAGGPISLSLT